MTPNGVIGSERVSVAHVHDQKISMDLLELHWYRDNAVHPAAW